MRIRLECLIFVLFPIKLDLFGESRFQLVLRNKNVMGVPITATSSSPRGLRPITKNSPNALKEEPDAEDV